MHSACRPFTKNKERIEKFKETGDSRYIYQNGQDKACFQRYMAYGDFKDLNGRTIADKVLRDKGFNIAKNSKYDGYLMVYKFLIKKSASLADKSASGSSIKNKNTSNKELGKELLKTIIRKIEKRNVHSPSTHKERKSYW